MLTRLATALLATVLLIPAANAQTTAPEKTAGPESPAARPGGAFNLRILSDSVPDFSSLDNFVYSATSAWPTDHEKTLAQWRWVNRSRRVGSCVYEDGRPVLDPVLFFNSYGVTFCSMVAQMNCSLWEARGRPSRVVDLTGHVVSELLYDDAWHTVDNDFCNYFLNEKGQIASTADLAGSRVHYNVADLASSRVHYNVADLKPGEYYIFDHCPAASTAGGRIFMGPASACLAEVAGDWYGYPGKPKPRLGYSGSHAGQRYILGLRPGESYTRYWQPLGTGEKFARLFPNGKDPSEEGGQALCNSRANGKWEWDADLKDPGTFFEIENGTVEPDGVKVLDKTKPGYVVFRVMSANVICSIDLRVGGSRDAAAAVYVSADGGLSWQQLKGAATVGPIGAVWTAEKEVAGRLECLVKVEVDKTQSLSNLKLTTTTQVNPRTLPALKLGANNIVAVSDGHYETMTFSPRLSGEQAAKEVFKVANFKGIDKPTDTQPTVYSTGDAELVLKATTPRPITGLRMATTMMQPGGGSDFWMATSFDGGKQWDELRRDKFAGWPADHRYQARLDKVPAGSREVQMKYAFDEAGCGLVNVFAEVNYEPAGRFMPYCVTYAWAEYHDGKWVDRRHSEKIDGPYHKYTINVGGERPPVMSWVRVSALSGKGTSPEKGTGTVFEKELENGASPLFLTGPRVEKPGYSDGQDVGDKFARPGYRIELGRNVAKDCQYQVSRPASEAYPDLGGKLLTDGWFSVSNFYGLNDINLAGKKNLRRVGDLVCWEPGGEVAVTVDLGKSQTIGGVRICALQPNERILYPDKMTVETSADGKVFVEAGRIGWEECFFPPADVMLWEGVDSPHYAKLPAGGMLDYRYPVVFKQPVEARFVRFRMSPPKDPAAGIALWELEVFDRMTRLPWEDTVRLPEGPRK